MKSVTDREIVPRVYAFSSILINDCTKQLQISTDELYFRLARLADEVFEEQTQNLTHDNPRAKRKPLSFLYPPIRLYVRWAIEIDEEKGTDMYVGTIKARRNARFGETKTCNRFSREYINEIGKKIDQMLEEHLLGD